MQDDLQKELEREIRKEGLRDWAYQHRTALTIIALMIAAMAIGALVTYVSDQGGQGGDSTEITTTNGVAATVDGQEIKEEEVSAYILQYRNYAGYQEDGDWATFLDGMSKDASAMREDAIKALARRIVVSEHADEVGVSVTDDEIDARIAEEAKEAGHSDDMEAYVTGTLMYASMDDYRADIKMEILLDKLLENDMEPIEPTELQMVLQASGSTASYIGSRTYDAVIEVPEDATASEVGSLKAIAEEFFGKASECKTTEEFLGIEGDGMKIEDRGWSCLYEPTAAYLEALSNLQAGGVSEPFRDEDGWHVVWCAETFMTRPDSTISLSEMPEEIYRALKVDTMKALEAEEMASYADNLLSEHDLQVNDMPSGLPYDVDMSLSSYRQETTEEDVAEIAQSGLDDLERFSEETPTAAPSETESE